MGMLRLPLSGGLTVRATPPVSSSTLWHFFFVRFFPLADIVSMVDDVPVATLIHIPLECGVVVMAS